MSSIEDNLAGLLDSPVWVAWDMSGGRKVPKSPFGGNARSNDPTTWGTYREAASIAQERGYSGIGVMLSDGVVGIDLDGVVGSDGKIADWAQRIIDDVGSYAEISPSGTGVHILAYADPEKIGAIGRANHRIGLEVYNHGRYFTVTGDSVNDEPLADRTQAVARLLAERFPAESAEDRLRRGVRQTVEDQVRRRANETMRKNAARDGLRYARVPMGAETCTFCIMLASRGFVYHSEAKAGGEGNHYHSNCRCKVIPGFPDAEVEGYDPDALYGVWQTFEGIDADEGLSVAEKNAAKRAVLDGHDARAAERTLSRIESSNVFGENLYKLTIKEIADQADSIDEAIPSLWHEQKVAHDYGGIFERFVKGFEGIGSIACQYWAKPEGKELQLASWLSRMGHDVEFLTPSGMPGDHTPDIRLDGELWEIKRISSKNPTKAKSRISDGLRQSDSVIVDLSVNENAAIIETAAVEMLEDPRARRIMVIKGGTARVYSK